MIAQRIRQWGSGIWLLLFGFIILVYIFHQPPLIRVAQNLLPLAYSLLILCSLWGLGWPIAWMLSPEGLRTQPAISLAFGLGMTAILTFICGMLWTFSPAIFGVWFLAGLVVFVVAHARGVRFATPEKSQKVRWDAWNVLGLTIIVFFLLQSIPFVVAPEVSSDALQYHLLVPRLYLERGQIYPLTLFVEANYPSLAEYIYLPTLLLFDEIVCKSLHFWIGIVLLISISRLASRVNPGCGRFTAPAFFVAMPVTIVHMGWAWNDFIYVLFVLLSLHFMIHYHTSAPARRNGKILLVAGLLAGLASWTKYTFAMFFLTSLLIFLVGIRIWKWNPRHILMFFLGISVVAPFWLFQNYIFTGNPTYPFLNRIFQSPFWPEATNEFFMKAVNRFEIPHWTWTNYFTFPFDLSIRPRLVDTQIGILPLMLIPFLFFRSATSGVTFLKVYLICALFVWLFIQTETRSLLSVLAVFFIVSSIALEQVRWPGKMFRHLALISTGTAVAVNFFFTLLTTNVLFDPVKYFLGRENREQYLRRLGTSHGAITFLNSQQDVTRVVVASFHEPYYLKHPYLFSSFADPPIVEVLTHGLRSPEEVWAKMRRLGISHLWINTSAYERQNQNGPYFWPPEQRRIFEEFAMKFCRPVVRFGNDRILKLSENGALENP